MLIYEPQPKLSSTERALLHLLAELIAGQSNGQTNLPTDGAILSEREAATLLRLLEEFASSKKFVESAYFVERVTQGDLENDSDLREIFLSWRKFYGRSRAMASTHWFDFTLRLGRSRSKFGYVRGLTKNPNEMPYRHFREMERLLLKRSGVSDRVQSLILSVIDKFENDVEASRHGDKPLPSGSISKLPTIISESIVNDVKFNLGTFNLNGAQAAGLMTVIADVSVLFTTRDWGVAGTLSTIAGGLAAVASPRP